MQLDRLHERFLADIAAERQRLSSRRGFLTGTAKIAGGGAAALAFAGAARPLSALAQDATPAAAPEFADDIEVLNYALTLEHLESTFYREGLETFTADDFEEGVFDNLTLVAEHEAAHVTAVTAAVEGAGGTPVAKPTFNFPEEVFADRAAFLMNASTFEELGVTAYHGQVPLIQSAEVLGAAAAIAGVESRHAAVIADIVGGDPFPAPVEGTRTMEEVLAAAQPFIQQ